MSMLSKRYEAALTLAVQLHEGQVRKGTTTPYASHLLAVSAIALEHGADEDQAIAALLHDAVEDAGGAPTLALLRAEFGDRVAAMVDACTDTDEEPKPPWRARKEAYIAHLRTLDPRDALIVSASDKLHNATAILRDLRVLGPAIFDRFTGRRDGTLWYYEALVEAYRCHPLPGRLGHLVDELERTVRTLRAEG